MTVFSLVPYLEDIGQEILETVLVKGYVYDIHGNPVEEEIDIRLNKNASQYKTQFTVDGETFTVDSDPADGGWSILLPDNSNMPSDSYYRFTINAETVRKSVPDYPLEHVLNQLDDY
jgi:hypothetical protein